MNSRGISPIGSLLWLIAIIAVGAIGYWYLSHSATTPESPQNENERATQDISIGKTSAYTLPIPADWTYEKETEESNLNLDHISVYDDAGKLVMRITFPLQEFSFEGTQPLEEGALSSNIGQLKYWLRSTSEESGWAVYYWLGADEFEFFDTDRNFYQSFKIFVHFRPGPLAITSEQTQQNTGTSVRYKSLADFKTDQEFIENILAGIRPQ